MSASDGSGRDSRSAPSQSAAWIESDSKAADAPRIGDSRLVRGGSKVVFVEGEPSLGEPPQGRSISEEEIAERGLLQDRVIEIGEMREEAVVSKQAVVREELVVRRDVEQRTERIEATVRRTEVDVEQIEPEAARSDGRGDESGR